MHQIVYIAFHSALFRAIDNMTMDTLPAFNAICFLSLFNYLTLIDWQKCRKPFPHLGKYDITSIENNSKTPTWGLYHAFVSYTGYDSSSTRKLAGYTSPLHLSLGDGWCDQIRVCKSNCLTHTVCVMLIAH